MTPRPPSPSTPSEAPYAGLAPEVVLDALDAVGQRGDGRLLQLNSYENRVFQVFLEDGSAVVAKFYRPARWSDAQILEEHGFAAELAAHEIPVAAPLPLAVDAQSLHAAHEQAFQALGDIGATKELLRLPVLVRAFAQVHLPEVRRELRLLVAPARHVGVRRNKLAPGLERAGRGRLDQRAARLALLAAYLLVEGEPAQLELHPIDFLRLQGRDRGEQPRHRIERPISVVARERLLVRPLVAAVA